MNHLNSLIFSRQSFHYVWIYLDAFSKACVYVCVCSGGGGMLVSGCVPQRVGERVQPVSTLWVMRVLSGCPVWLCPHPTIFCVLRVIMCVFTYVCLFPCLHVLSFSIIHTFHIYSLIFWQSAFFIPGRIFIDVIIWNEKWSPMKEMEEKGVFIFLNRRGRASWLDHRVSLHFLRVSVCGGWGQGQRGWGGEKRSL